MDGKNSWRRPTEDGLLITERDAERIVRLLFFIKPSRIAPDGAVQRAVNGTMQSMAPYVEPMNEEEKIMQLLL